MEIKKVKIRNLLSFGNDPTSIDLSRFNIIVGPNASGKTNFLRALTYVGKCLSQRRWSLDTDFFHSGPSSEGIEIEVAISLTEDETNAIANYIVLSILANNPPTKDGLQQAFTKEFAFEIALVLKEKLSEPFRNISVIVRRRNKEISIPEILLKFTFFNLIFYMDSNGKINLTDNNAESSDTDYFSWLLVKNIHILDPKFNTKNYSSWKEKTILTKNNRINNFFNSITKQIEKNRVSVKFLDYIQLTDSNLPVKAANLITELKDFLSHHGYTDVSISFFHLIGHIYNNSIIRISELRSRPEKNTILPTNLDNMADQMTEFDGRDLSKVLFHLKNSTDHLDRTRYSEIVNSFKEMTDCSFDVVLRTISNEHPESGSNRKSFLVSVPTYEDEELPHIEPSPDTYKHEIEIIIEDKKRWIPLRFSAAGLFEILLILTVLIGHKHKVLLLDEPASNLHPLKQIEIRKMLEQISKKKELHNQIVIVTHSSELIGMENTQNTFRFYNENGSTRILSVGEALTQMNLQKEIGGKGTDSQWGEMLFASGIVLVEGLSDKYVIEILDRYLRENGANLQNDNWSVIHIGGKSGFPFFIELGLKLKLNFKILTDSDGVMDLNYRGATTDPSKRIPQIFTYLDKNGVLTSKDKKQLLTFERVNGSFLKEKFQEITGIAKKYGVFALPTKLEDVLNKSNTSRKVKSALEAAEDLIKRGDKVPIDIMNFFTYLKEEKESHKSN